MHNDKHILEDKASYPEIKETGYDLISIANGTRAEVESAKSKLNTHELAIVTDEDKLVYKDNSGNIKEFTSGAVDELEARMPVTTIADLQTTEVKVGDVIQVLG